MFSQNTMFKMPKTDVTHNSVQSTNNEHWIPGDLARDASKQE